MDAEFSADEILFREEVRAFLAADLPKDLRAAARTNPTVFAEPDVGRRWQAILHAKGWLAYQWPATHGGTGWSPVQRYIFEKECALAGAPDLPVMGLKLLAPVLHRFGSAEQQRRYLPRILSNEDYWCQGFSEPGAGSDLAGLTTKATRVGDHYRINGGKLWTTHAQFADHIFCLVRTASEAKPQQGISFLLVDMRQPGVEVHPVLGLAGDHEVNAVFFDDAVAPAEDLVGEEGQGWTIAKFLLENERGGSCFAPRLLADLVQLRAAARAEPGDDGRSLAQQTLHAARLARLEFEAMALETTELRILAEIARGAEPGPQTSLVKLVASTLRQQIDALSMATWGPAGLQLPRERPLHGQAAPRPIRGPDAQAACARYLNGRAWTIFGGSNEIQRTIIARTVLRL